MAAGQNAALKEAPKDGEGLDPQHPARGVTRIIDAAAGRIELLMPDGTTPRKKIALCGFASTTREMAPYADPAWAIVGMNQLNRMVPRADAWFEIHRVWNAAVVPGTDHAAFIKDCGMPVFMTDDAARTAFPDTWTRYPIERLIQKFNDYYTSTVAFMLAWAIDYIDERVQAAARASGFVGSAIEGANFLRSLYADYAIGIYGIDLVVGEEYVWQRPCAEYYLGQALARDIAVHVPKPSALLKQRYRYGYDMEPDDLIKDSDLEKIRVDLVNNHQQHADEVQRLIGGQMILGRIRELRELRERGATI